MTEYPMNTLAQARDSIMRAVRDRDALRITTEQLKQVRNDYAHRLTEIKKAALLSSAAKLGVRSFGNTSVAGKVSSTPNRHGASFAPKQRSAPRPAVRGSQPGRPVRRSAPT